MALVVNTNSYVSLADANSYMDNRIDNANWTAASDTLKEQALITATMVVDERPWIGYSTSSSQLLAWPRSGASYYDVKMGRTLTFDKDEVPARIETAVYEQALHLLNNEDLLTDSSQTFESITIGEISVSDTAGELGRTPKLPGVVYKLITPLTLNNGVHSWWRAN